MMRVLEQLGWASVAGGAVRLARWLLARFALSSAAARSTVWRLAIATLLILFAVTSVLDLPLLAPPSRDEAAPAGDENPALAPPVPGWVIAVGTPWAAGALAGVAPARCGDPVVRRTRP